MTRIEIKACNQVDGQVVWCENAAEACAFGVYMGEAGAFVWQADFRLYGDAVEWATALGIKHNAEITNHVRLN